MTAMRAYLDYNASAPLRPEAKAAVLAAIEITGNASSTHGEGRHARSIIETAREQVAALVGARTSDVVFTSGATEANNMVLNAGWSTIFVPQIEHDSVLAPARASRARVIELEATGDGVVRAEAFAEHVLCGKFDYARSLMSVQMANNETGVMQPLEDIAAFAREHCIRVHTDAVQAAGRREINLAGLGIDFLTLSSHKIGGPRGAGAIVIRDGAKLPPLLLGGGQERRRRAGTENVEAIAGFGAAAEAAAGDIGRMKRVGAMRDRLEREIEGMSPGAVVIGRDAARLANTACIALPGQLAETLVIKMDMAGVAISAGSACSSGKIGASHVLSAMGFDAEIARSAVRISLGIETRDDDIERLLRAWREICAAREARPADAGTGRASIEPVLGGV